MKKAQMKIQQMAFMLIAVTIFFVLVGMFFLTIKMATLKKDAAFLKEQEAKLLLDKLASSPEFSCGTSFDEQIPNCIDFDKVMVLKSKISNYSKFWGVSNIEIIRQDTKSTESCTPQNYPDCKILSLMSENAEGISVSNFISLCRRSSIMQDPYNYCEVAKILITYNEN